MIIGSGDIASVLKDRKGFLFHAAGVSNSQETDEFEYQREATMVLDQPKEYRLVYFSSLAIFYGKGRYVQHKRDMEQMIMLNFPKYTIVRIGNILWGTNPHTLINYLREQKHPQIRDEYRYVVDKDEFLHWINLIPDFNCEMNVPGQRMKVQEIYDKYCRIGKKGKNEE